MNDADARYATGDPATFDVSMGSSMRPFSQGDDGATKGRRPARHQTPQSFGPYIPHMKDIVKDGEHQAGFMALRPESREDYSKKAQNE